MRSAGALENGSERTKNNFRKRKGTLRALRGYADDLVAPRDARAASFAPQRDRLTPALPGSPPGGLTIVVKTAQICLGHSDHRPAVVHAHERALLA